MRHNALPDYTACHRMIKSCAVNDHIIGFTTKARLHLLPARSFCQFPINGWMHF